MVGRATPPLTSRKAARIRAILVGTGREDGGRAGKKRTDIKKQLIDGDSSASDGLESICVLAGFRSRAMDEKETRTSGNETERKRTV